MPSRYGRTAAFSLIAVWFYFLLAAILNPLYSSSNIPVNPVAPFLSADLVSKLWPILLVSSPLILAASHQLVQLRGGRRREVSPEQFARIQSRAHQVSAADRSASRRGGDRTAPTSVGQVAPTQTPEPEGPQARNVPSKQHRRAAAVTPPPRTEFTPPPTTSRRSMVGEPAGTKIVEESTVKPTTQEKDEQAGRKAEAERKRIEELEAEKAAVISLMDELEELRIRDDMKPDLYERLKRKYASEIEKIGALIEDILTGRESEEE